MPEKSRSRSYLDNGMQALDTTQKLRKPFVIHRTQLRPYHPDCSMLVYNLLIGHSPLAYAMNSNFRAAVADILSSSQPWLNRLMLVVP